MYIHSPIGSHNGLYCIYTDNYTEDSLHLVNGFYIDAEHYADGE